MVVSGRVHAAVAALSQSVPTVIIDYGHEPRAHKLMGFATVAQVQEYVANPCSFDDLKQKITNCFFQKELYKAHLDKRISEIYKDDFNNFGYNLY